MRRVLIVSADMGGGHNAAGRAMQEAVHHAWPDCEVRWVDALQATGWGAGPLLRWLYVLNIQHTPFVYRFFFACLWRHRWFARAAKWFVGVVIAGRLAAAMDRVRPDLVISTYPLGSAGLARLRRQHRLRVPAIAVTSDFAPHPFWIYRDLDVNLVVHPAAVSLAHAAEPDAVVEVCGLPVLAAFHDGERAAARQALDLPAQAFVALLSCGSYAFGAVVEATEALLAADDSVLAVVVCGRNDALVARLVGLGHSGARLRVLGWVQDMASLVRAADVVVSNAGGVTALEALATRRPLVMYRPIAAHGEANAALLAAAGEAVVCGRPEQLAAAIRAARGAPCPAATGIDLESSVTRLLDRLAAGTPVAAAPRRRG